MATLVDSGLKANQFPGRFHCEVVEALIERQLNGQQMEVLACPSLRSFFASLAMFLLVSTRSIHFCHLPELADSSGSIDWIDRESPAIVLNENLSESCEGAPDLVLRVFGLTSRPRATRWEMSSMAYSASVGASWKIGGYLV